MLQWCWKGKTSLCWWMWGVSRLFPPQKGGFCPGTATWGPRTWCASETFAYFSLEYFEWREMIMPFLQHYFHVVTSVWQVTTGLGPVWFWTKLLHAMEKCVCLCLSFPSYFCRSLFSDLFGCRKHAEKTYSASVNQLPSLKSCTNIPVNSQYRRPVLPPACSPSVVLQQDLGGRHCFEEPLTFSFSSRLPRHFALPTMPELPASPKKASVGLYVGMPLW